MNSARKGIQKSGIAALALIPLFLFSFAPASAVAQTSSSHDVFESQNGLQITNSNPIPYYPGVLIGMPISGTLSNASTVATSSVGRDQIAIGEGTVTGTSGARMIIVITDSVSGFHNVVGIGTIIDLASNGVYQSAETDVYVQNETSIQGLFSTQDHVYQTTPETLAQHYGLLAEAMARLAHLYASAGSPQVGLVYTLAAAQLLRLSFVISSQYPTYDKTISTPRGVVVLNMIPDVREECSSVYLATTDPSSGDNMGGTFSSWYLTTGYGDQIEYSGQVSFSGPASLSDDFIVYIQASPIAITSASITPAWGGAQYDYVSQQIQSQFVLWYVLGALPGGWSTVVSTNWASAPSPASVGVEVSANPPGQYSYLGLC